MTLDQLETQIRRHIVPLLNPALKIERINENDDRGTVLRVNDEFDVYFVETDGTYSIDQLIDASDPSVGMYGSEPSILYTNLRLYEVLAALAVKIIETALDHSLQVEADEQYADDYASEQWAAQEVE